METLFWISHANHLNSEIDQTKSNPGSGSKGVVFLIIDLADLVVTKEMVSVSDVSVETGVLGIELLPVDDLFIVGVVLLSVGFLTFPNPLPIKQTSFG